MAFHKVRLEQEQSGQPYNSPACNQDEILSKTSIFIEDLINTLDEDRSTCVINDDHSAINKNCSKSGKKPYQHLSVQKLYNTYQNIIIPEEVYRSDIAPVISLDSDEVREWFEEHGIIMEIPLINMTPEPSIQINSNKNIRSTVASRRRSRNSDKEIEEEVIPPKKIRVFQGENNLSNYLPEFLEKYDASTGYECYLCKKTFEMKTYLASHIKQFHPQNLDESMTSLIRPSKLRNQLKKEPVENVQPTTSTRARRVDSKQNVLQKFPGVFVGTSTSTDATSVKSPTSNDVASKKMDDCKKPPDPISAPSNALEDTKQNIKIDESTDTVFVCEPERLQSYFKDVKNCVSDDDVFKHLWGVDKIKITPKVSSSSQTFSFIPKDQIKFPAANSILLTNLVKEIEQHQVPVYFQDNTKFVADFKKRIISSKSKVLLDWSEKEVKMAKGIRTYLYPSRPVLI